ncbi:MAG: hypothetical protein ACK4JE_06170, partial [Endomicrobiia bacterium]
MTFLKPEKNSLIDPLKIKENIKENTILISILLVVYKLVLPINTSLIPFIINELLVFGVLYFLFNYMNTVVETKKETPLSLVLNTGILG